ncbi:MAG: GDSL-type esterase/lipase family protein [Vicinamibacterales bacterium]
MHHRLLAVLTALALLASLPLAAQQAQAPSAPRDFWIYAWRTPKITGVDARAKAMADAGFTVVNAAPEELDAIAKHGLKAMVETKDVAVAKRLASNTAVFGYHLGDEPWPEAVFAGIGRNFRAFQAAAPRHVPFVNMLSTTGEFLRRYMDEARPTLLSFDYYQWWWGSDRYFEKLEQFREAAVRAGVPLAACFEVSANPGVEWGDQTRLADNDRKLRQSIYTSLAYGVTGVEWFQADMIFTAGTGALTPVGVDVAAINKEILPLGRVLAPLTSVDVFHTAPYPAGTRSAPKEHWVQTIAEEGRAGFVTGMFRDRMDRDYVLVANRDYREPQNLVMKLQSKWLGIAPWYAPKQFKYAIDRFDRAAGAWTTIASSSSVGFNYVIPAAEGELFRITTTLTTDGKAEGWTAAAAPNPDPARFEKDIAAFEAQDKAAPPAPGGTLFVGSSSITQWDVAREFPDLKPIKRGYGGSHVTDTIHFAPRIIWPYKPSLVVFYAGDADVAGGKTAEQIASDTTALVALIHKQLPATKVLVIGTKPSPLHWRHIETMRAANAAIKAALANDRLAAYADAEAALLGSGGLPRPEFYQGNGLNLSQAGYVAWTAALRPAIMQLRAGK